MNYQECVKKLFSVNVTGGVKLGLQNIEMLMKLLGNPQDRFKAIHVAGTNGKGSCVTKVAVCLEKAGYKVGLYTSPHISSFRERIRVNGQMISETDVVRILEPIFELAKTNQIPATFFEYTTACAYVYFAECGVDFAVLETGLGGRLDATCICKPILTAITSISVDHAKFLGTTEEEIAEEKAGIMKAKIPIVIGPHVPEKIIEKVAQPLGCPVYRVENDNVDFEIENQKIASKVIEVLSKTVQIPENAKQAALDALPPCRFEIVDEKQLEALFGKDLPKAVILDVAHNPDGVKRLFERIQNIYGDLPITSVFGMSYDKDVISSLKILIDYSTSIYFVQSPMERACRAEDLKRVTLKMSLHPEVHANQDLRSGLQEAFDNAKQKKHLLLICGTFFIMKDARAFLGFHEIQDSLDLNEGHFRG